MGRKLNFYFMIYGSNSRSMEGRTRRGYRAQEAQQRQKKGSRVDARKKELPSLQDSSTAINLRIVYPQIIFVVGVSEEINDSKELKKPENLSRYGEVVDIRVRENAALDRRKYMVRYKEPFQAALAFRGINLLKRDGSPLRAYYSKNKFCLHFARGDNCRKYNCPFIHEDFDSARYFFEDETNASYFEDNMSRLIITENLKAVRMLLEANLQRKLRHSKFFLRVAQILEQQQLPEAEAEEAGNGLEQSPKGGGEKTPSKVGEREMGLSLKGNSGSKQDSQLVDLAAYGILGQQNPGLNPYKIQGGPLDEYFEMCGMIDYYHVLYAPQAEFSTPIESQNGDREELDHAENNISEVGDGKDDKNHDNECHNDDIDHESEEEEEEDREFEDPELTAEKNTAFLCQKTNSSEEQSLNQTCKTQKTAESPLMMQYPPAEDLYEYRRLWLVKDNHDMMTSLVSEQIEDNISIFQVSGFPPYMEAPQKVKSVQPKNKANTRQDNLLSINNQSPYKSSKSSKKRRRKLNAQALSKKNRGQSVFKMPAPAPRKNYNYYLSSEHQQCDQTGAHSQQDSISQNQSIASNSKPRKDSQPAPEGKENDKEDLRENKESSNKGEGSQKTDQSATLSVKNETNIKSDFSKDETETQEQNLVEEEGESESGVNDKVLNSSIVGGEDSSQMEHTKSKSKSKKVDQPEAQNPQKSTPDEPVIQTTGLLSDKIIKQQQIQKEKFENEEIQIADRPSKIGGLPSSQILTHENIFSALVNHESPEEGNDKNKGSKKANKKSKAGKKQPTSSQPSLFSSKAARRKKKNEKKKKKKQKHSGNDTGCQNFKNANKTIGSLEVSSIQENETFTKSEVSDMELVNLMKEKDLTQENVLPKSVRKNSEHLAPTVTVDNQESNNFVSKKEGEEDSFAKKSSGKGNKKNQKKSQKSESVAPKKASLEVQEDDSSPQKSKESSKKLSKKQRQRLKQKERKQEQKAAKLAAANITSSPTITKPTMKMEDIVVRTVVSNKQKKMREDKQIQTSASNSLVEEQINFINEQNQKKQIAAANTALIALAGKNSGKEEKEQNLVSKGTGTLEEEVVEIEKSKKRKRKKKKKKKNAKKNAEDLEGEQGGLNSTTTATKNSSSQQKLDSKIVEAVQVPKNSMDLSQQDYHPLSSKKDIEGMTGEQATQIMRSIMAAANNGGAGSLPEVNRFLNEDSLDNIADEIYTASLEAEDDPLVSILSVLDTHIRVSSDGRTGSPADRRLKSSYEIFVDSNAKSMKIAFLGDNRTGQQGGLPKFI